MRSLVLGLMLAAASAAGAAPSDFSFNALPLQDIASTIGLLGQFNVLVAPDIGAVTMDYHRAGVEPAVALEEVAKVAATSLREVKGATPPLYVMTKAPLPADLRNPAAGAAGTPTDFNFKAVELTNVAQTMAVLGHFDVAVAPGVASQRLSVRLRQIPPADAMFWTATAAGLIVEYKDAGGKALFTLGERK